MPDRLFGTDGVRGTAGRAPLDVATIRRLGAALVRVLAASPTRLIVGRDTRESSPWIERELAYGARSAGAHVTSVGVLPTPAVAYLTRSLGFNAGLMISASHNPFEDNGIKVFSGEGAKYGETTERQIEALIADPSWTVPDGEAPGVDSASYVDAYLEHSRLALPDAGRLKGSRLGIDCANGAMTGHAARLLRDLGFDVTAFGSSPDGRNINLGCGSTHPEALAEAVRTLGLSFGVAFDGDGDRAIFVDHLGQIVDGDAVLLMCARQLKAEGRLKGNAIVATVMSNIGLEIGLRESGIGLVRCAVGDKYVMEELAARGLVLGGEQSGHIIFADQMYTGDGLITALNVLRTIATTGRELADLAGQLQRFPQVLVNVRVRRRTELRDIPEIADVMTGIEGRLGRQGRLLVRYSGTEPLLRIMLEGPDEGAIRLWANEIADQVRKHLA
jgi:phosphoglucosamine mutase